MMACIVCRSRKVRCDQSRPECQNCERLGVRCPGYEGNLGDTSSGERNRSVEAIYQASGVQKRRVGSCDACRLSKSRCTKTRPICRRCLVRGVDCIYSTKSASIDTSSVSRSSLESPTQIVGTPTSEISILPETTALQSRLFNAFFDRVHPLRCLAFLHRPSFFYALDRGTLLEDYDEPLLLVMCALGARHILLDSVREHADTVPSQAEDLAQKARMKVLAHLHEPTIYHLMAMILLCEHAGRADQIAMAFILVGSIFRQIRLMGLDTPTDESDTALVPSKQEMKNRLVWASYGLDVLLGSGVDKNSSWRDDFPRVPLPCSEADFLMQMDSKPVFLAYVLENPHIMKQLDPPGLSVVLTYLRTKVLRYIRTTGQECNIWDSKSPFLGIIKHLEDFYDNLPHKYVLTEVNMYMLKDQRLLGAIFSLHFLYHAAICDLTRVSLPGFTFPLAVAFKDAPLEFVTQCQRRCRLNAEEISNLVRRGQIHRQTAFDDSAVVEVAYESAKIQVVYCATVVDETLSIERTKSNITTNLNVLTDLSSGRGGPSPHLRALVPLCVAFGFLDLVQDFQHQDIATWSIPAEVTGPANMHHLSNMAFFRRAILETGTRFGTSNQSVVQSEANSTRSQDQTTRQELPLSTIEPMPGEISHAVIEASTLPTLGAADIRVSDMTSEPMNLEHGNLMPEPIHEYIRAAEEISDFLTWDTAEWWNVNSGG